MEIALTVLTILVTLLALLSHWGKKNQVAEVILLVILLLASFLVLGLATLAGTMLLLSAADGTQGTGGLLVGVPAVVAFVGAGLAGLALCVPPLLKMLGRPPRRPFWSDPPIFFALWLFVPVLALHLAQLLLFEQITDALTLSSESRVSPGFVLASQLPLMVVALAGVGAGVRRAPREILARLGYGRVTPLQLGVVVLFIVGAFVMQFLADSLFAALQPELYERVGEVSDALFNLEGLDPVAVVLFALLIGVGAATGEETLFRGAVQPVFGIVLTSVLFASLHIQYGPSVLLGYVFVLSLGLGLLRKYINTPQAFSRTSVTTLRASCWCTFSGLRKNGGILAR